MATPDTRNKWLSCAHEIVRFVVIFSFFSSSSFASSDTLPDGPQRRHGRKKRGGWRVSASCEPHSCCFTHANLRWRHKEDAASRDSLDGDTMQVMGPMARIQQSIKAGHIFLRKSPRHIRMTLAGANCLIAPAGCENSLPSRRQTYSTCSGSSVTDWPSLDVVPASLDDLLLESLVVCCRKDKQLLNVMLFKC